MMTICQVEESRREALTQQLAAAQEQISVLTVHGQRLRDALATAYEKLKIVCGGMREYQGGMPTQALFPLLESALSALPQQVKSEDAMGERAKADRDAMLYGQGFMVGGKHVPLQDILIIPPSISAQEEKDS